MLLFNYSHLFDLEFLCDISMNLIDHLENEAP